ncbi:hypothetical protein SAMN05660860_00268 [Geoalkalibacter ferrihydriticus]|uniref:Uncharacterized protein n=2 Tax=Geoalkalibacter ferrihydriticus TaxID=392333 RepID=A0A0C2HS56_9BACT|nr:hypothetical protein [Geoalkalibacter ferrihydriticus]KIH75602.1 hypothetical protein GFER_15800 [Geoalkalibacter ferrihydriticus DSM 17813]SDL29742.1 hypothetical protein SAMN05660860_00268 [Geoalkalibacter ferrihydriticus]
MESIQVHLFKDSFGPFLTLLNEEKVQYKMRSARSAEPMACSELLEILTTDGFWQGLAAVIVAFLGRNTRKVIITTKDNQIIHAENISKEELEEILKKTKSITAIESKKK